MASLIADSLRLAGSRWSDAHFLQQVRSEQAQLRSLSSAELLVFSTSLRERMATGQVDPQSTLLAFALAGSALDRALGVHLYDVQLIASRALAEGKIAEMQTGEGKTFAAVPAAVWGGLQGRGVHISTPNTYLAQRDFEQLAPVYEVAGLSVGMLPEEPGSEARKRDAYACDVTYGSGYEFGFDYLRDQLVLRARSERKLGQSLLQTLSPSTQGHLGLDLMQRGLAYAIVDEADNVLIDDATSPLVLSESQLGEAADAEAVRLARHVALYLGKEHVVETTQQQVELSDAGRQRIFRGDIVIPVQQLQRPWTSYVETALRAERLFFRDVHYVVDQGEIKIVDSSTGRIFADRAWQSGLHQAVEAKEGLQITPERSALAQITRQRFYRLYDRLAGMTGTATTCRGELSAVYGVRTRVIPLRTPSRRSLYPARFFLTQEAKWLAILQSIQEIHQTGRPILIGTRTIAESQRLVRLLEPLGLRFQVLNDRQDKEEAEIVAGAGQTGEITIATNLAGRGTDIKLTTEVRDLGGLHVIVSECHESSRIDRQMIGRAGRQGDPGSAQIFVAMDDWLIQNFGPWLARSVARLGNGLGEVALNLGPQVKRIQLVAERQRYAVRARMLRSDLDNDNLFDQ